jgi:hypothetical protein
MARVERTSVNPGEDGRSRGTVDEGEVSRSESSIEGLGLALRIVVGEGLCVVRPERREARGRGTHRSGWSLRGEAARRGGEGVESVAQLAAESRLELAVVTAETHREGASLVAGGRAAVGLVDCFGARPVGRAGRIGGGAMRPRAAGRCSSLSGAVLERAIRSERTETLDSVEEWASRRGPELDTSC